MKRLAETAVTVCTKLKIKHHPADHFTERGKVAMRYYVDLITNL